MSAIVLCVYLHLNPLSLIIDPFNQIATLLICGANESGKFACDDDVVGWCVCVCFVNGIINIIITSGLFYIDNVGNNDASVSFI